MEIRMWRRKGNGICCCQVRSNGNGTAFEHFDPFAIELSWSQILGSLFVHHTIDDEIREREKKMNQLQIQHAAVVSKWIISPYEHHSKSLFCECLFTFAVYTQIRNIQYQFRSMQKPNCKQLRNALQQIRRIECKQQKSAQTHTSN